MNKTDNQHFSFEAICNIAERATRRNLKDYGADCEVRLFRDRRF
ncbi:hypothetical protein [Paenibacillus hunanensis]|uniref:Uncharacterized protein n=1 Tax=Paenibacillus hunanensis TaxID=539262 RepID=A0ABU1J510_9BACL|nr:hypothetical protein [Paenibacillus hunanensis]MDR6246335.1 hypothetical protein [Paenibacillus hunanensis]GGJ30557.1 hypothetical protein GCM10008022_44160 [Paenibacillus hunanensis]